MDNQDLVMQVAEKVMGWKWYEVEGLGGGWVRQEKEDRWVWALRWFAYCDECDKKGDLEQFTPRTDANHLLMVIEKMRLDNWLIIIMNYHKDNHVVWKVKFYERAVTTKVNRTEHEAEHKDLGTACLEAALKAVGGEENKP